MATYAPTTFKLRPLTYVSGSMLLNGFVGSLGKVRLAATKKVRLSKPCHTKGDWEYLTIVHNDIGNPKGFGYKSESCLDALNVCEVYGDGKEASVGGCCNIWIAASNGYFVTFCFELLGYRPAYSGARSEY